MQWIFWVLLFCVSCSSDNKTPSEFQAKGEYIYRLHDEYLFNPDPPKRRAREVYPWENESKHGIPRISKEYFRCKGSSMNPVRNIVINGQTQRITDCGGTDKHSLPLKDEKEFIYPILIDILNYIQTKTGKKVVITSGHRCPEHNTYVNSAPENQFSKHMLGAEAAFYVQGLEDRPEAILKLIFEYYSTTPKYKDDKSYLEFLRYEKPNQDTTTIPWYNKEIFVKLYKKNEGRDFDNRHPYPYLSIQVRYDYDRKEKVQYSWEKAFKSYLRK